MKYLYYATGNDDKFREARSFMREVYPDVTIEQMPIEIPEIQSSDPNEILNYKVQFVSKRVSVPFIVDDASFNTERYPGFPGTYAKFVNQTLSYEGWRRLFEDGDNIQAVTRLALYNFGDIVTFEGYLKGVLDLSHRTSSTRSFTLSDHFILSNGKNLTLSLEDPGFLNHRRLALRNLGEYLAALQELSQSKKETIGDRWSARASGWQKLIKDKRSYVNYEDNYERVNSLICKYAPLVSGDALEVGCGTGEAGRILKSANPSLRILATDIAEGMLGEARQLAARAGLKIDYRKVDIIDSDFEDDSFGIVVSRGVVVSHLPKSDIFDFLKSMARCVTPGGYLLFDFIQNVAMGEIEKPVDTKNEFGIGQIDSLMKYCDMVRIDQSGDSNMRVRVVCYQKLIRSGEAI